LGTAILHVQVGYRDARPHYVATLVDIALLCLEVWQFPTDDLAYLLHIARQVIAVGDLGKVPALELMSLVAEHLGKGRVDLYEVAYLVQDGHADGRVAEGELVGFVGGN